MIAAFIVLVSSLTAKPAKIVFISGKPSHPISNMSIEREYSSREAAQWVGLECEGNVFTDVGYPANVVFWTTLRP